MCRKARQAHGCIQLINGPYIRASRTAEMADALRLSALQTDPANRPYIGSIRITPALHQRSASSHCCRSAIVHLLVNRQHACFRNAS